MPIGSHLAQDGGKEGHSRCGTEFESETMKGWKSSSAGRKTAEALLSVVSYTEFLHNLTLHLAFIVMRS